MRHLLVSSIDGQPTASIVRGLAAIALLGVGLAAAPAAAEPLVHISKYELSTARAIVELETELEINSSLRDAVEGGNEVVFVTELKIMHERWFGDQQLEHYKWQGRVRRVQYGLGYEYQPFGSGQWAEASSIDEALALMDKVAIELDESSLVSKLRSFDTYLEYRVEVDLDFLPNPLKVDLLTSAEWKFSSGWQQTRK